MCEIFEQDGGMAPFPGPYGSLHLFFNLQDSFNNAGLRLVLTEPTWALLHETRGLFFFHADLPLPNFSNMPTCVMIAYKIPPLMVMAAATAIKKAANAFAKHLTGHRAMVLLFNLTDDQDFDATCGQVVSGLTVLNNYLKFKDLRYELCVAGRSTEPVADMLCNGQPYALHTEAISEVEWPKGIIIPAGHE